MIHPWLFEFFHAPEPGAPRGATEAKQRFDTFLDLWTRDEALGFEGIFFSEHHFGPGYSPAPNLLIAAMASRTSTMRLGVLGVSTAYLSPLRIVEEAAMLDNLTGGRLEFGMVRGIPTELELIGMSVPEGDARFDATLHAVDAAFASATGEFNCEGLVVEPPLQQQDLPRWLAITSERSARRAATMKWKACTGFLSIDTVAGLFDAYRDQAGLDYDQAADQLGLRRFVAFVDNSSDAAQAREALRDARITELKEQGPRAISKGPRSLEASGPAIFDVDGAIKALLHDDEFIVGTPADAAEQIIEQCRKAGSAHFMVNLHSTNDLEGKKRQHRIFGEEVIPILRKANLAAEKAPQAA